MTSRLPIAFVAIAVITLAACKPKVPEQTAPTAAASAATTAPIAAPAKRLPNVATAARIQEIITTGKTGFWTDMPEFCPGKSGRVAILGWNVTASGAKKVIVYAVGTDGKEQNFGHGGPVGERQTGPWVHPDVQFKLRNAEGGAELGSLSIPRGKSC